MSDFNLFLLNKLSQLKGGGGSSSGGSQGQTLDTSTNSTSGGGAPIFMVQSVNLRTAIQSSSQGYWTTGLSGFSTYNPNTNNVANRTVNFFGASGRVNPISGEEPACENSTGYNAAVMPHQRLLFGSNTFIGTAQYQNAVGSFSTSYPPIMYGIMFIKNTTDAPITRSLTSYASVQANSSYSYGHVFLYTPNAANYADVTNVSNTELSQRTSTATNWTVGNSVTVPARTTVAVVIVNSVAYDTGIYNGRQCMYNQGFYSLQSFFTADGSLQCDAKATLAYLTLKDGDMGAKATDYSDITRFYNNIAAVYGENA